MSDEPNLTEEERRHKARTRKHKAVVDARIAAAKTDKGLVLVLTGNGKGKSSSAFGMVARSLGYGRTAAVFQFIKGKEDVGERAFLSRQPGVTWENCGEGFTWETQDRRRDIAAAQLGWAKARRALADPDVSLVVLDELTYSLVFRPIAALIFGPGPSAQIRDALERPQPRSEKLASLASDVHARLSRLLAFNLSPEGPSELLSISKLLSGIRMQFSR